MDKQIEVEFREFGLNNHSVEANKMLDGKRILLFSERLKLAEEYEEWVKKPLEDGSKIKDCALTVITFMHSKGFCKIPENAVVLTKEEYDELQKGIKTYNYTAMFDAQSTDRWEQGYLQGKKETAKEIYEKAKAKSIPTFVNIDDNPRKDSSVFLSDLKNIVREKDVEVE